MRSAVGIPVVHGGEDVNVDPQSDDAWARLEAIVPFGCAADRPSVRASKRSASDVYARFESAFNTLWDASVEPGDNSATQFAI